MNENTTTEDPTRVRLALKAADIITGDRQADYGPPEVNFQRIANLWNDHMETTMFTPRKVSELMLLLKIARTVNSPTEDSYVDLIGYAALAGEMAETERKEQLRSSVIVKDSAKPTITFNLPENPDRDQIGAIAKAAGEQLARNMQATK